MKARRGLVDCTINIILANLLSKLQEEMARTNERRNHLDLVEKIETTMDLCFEQLIELLRNAKWIELYCLADESIGLEIYMMQRERLVMILLLHGLDFQFSRTPGNM